MHYGSVAHVCACMLIGGVIAAPPNPNLRPNQVFLTDHTFDTFQTTGVAANPQQLGEYDFLNFININVVPQNLVLGVRSHTPPNVAAFTARTELGSPGQPFQITSNYTESPISYFQALSWRYGCVLGTDETVATPATPCTITATGFAPGGKQLAQQTFKFTPSGAPLSDSNLGIFNSQFNGLEKLVFQVSNNLTTVVLMDDFVANLFQNTANVIR